MIRQVEKDEAGYNKTVKTGLHFKILTKLCRNTSQRVTYVLTSKTYSEYNFRAFLTNIEFRFIIKYKFSIRIERGVLWHKY